MTRAEWIASALAHAKHARDSGSPISPPVVAAQAALESNFGESQLALQARNLFGIKAGSSWRGHVLLLPTVEWDGSKYVDTLATWRVYEDWTDCFRDYGRIIKGLSWYQDAEDAAQYPRDFLRGILVKRDELGDVTEPGWATDPRYEDKVWSVIEQYGLLEEEPPQEVDVVVLNYPLYQRILDAIKGRIERRTAWRIRAMTAKEGLKLDLAKAEEK